MWRHARGRCSHRIPDRDLPPHERILGFIDGLGLDRLALGRWRLVGSLGALDRLEISGPLHARCGVCCIEGVRQGVFASLGLHLGRCADPHKQGNVEQVRRRVGVARGGDRGLDPRIVRDGRRDDHGLDDRLGAERPEVHAAADEDRVAHRTERERGAVERALLGGKTHGPAAHVGLDVHRRTRCKDQRPVKLHDRRRLVLRPLLQARGLQHHRRQDRTTVIDGERRGRDVGDREPHEERIEGLERGIHGPTLDEYSLLLTAQYGIPEFRNALRDAFELCGPRQHERLARLRFPARAGQQADGTCRVTDRQRLQDRERLGRAP